MIAHLVLRWVVVFVVTISLVLGWLQRLNWVAIALAFGVSILAFVIDLVIDRHKAHRSQFEEFRRRARKRETPPV